MRFISLGSRCEIAHQLRRKGYRTVSYPLDWLICDDVQGLIQYFHENGKNLLDPELLTFQFHDWGCRATHKHYKFELVHDFSSPEQTVDEQFFRAVRDRYDRRYSRLVHTLTTAKDVVLLRKYGTKEEGAQLIRTLTEKFGDHLQIIILLDAAKTEASEEGHPYYRIPYTPEWEQDASKYDVLWDDLLEKILHHYSS